MSGWIRVSNLTNPPEAASLSPTRRAWQRFRRNRLGYWSLVIFCALVVLSLFAELISNDRPLIVRYEGTTYFPMVKDYSEKTFGGDFDTTTDYLDPFIRERRPSASASPSGKAVAKVASVATSVSNRPPQRVGGTIGRPGAPPTSNAKKPAGITMNPSSTRCRLAECERRTTHAQNRMKVAKQVQGRHNWSEG